MLICVQDYELAAKAKLDKVIYDFAFGGAQDEITLHENRKAYQRILFRPRVLRGAFDGDLSVLLCQTKASLPLIMAPTAFHKLYCEQGELATAMAASHENVVMIISMASTVSLDDLHARMQHHQGQFWFQFYVQPEISFNQYLVDMATKAGCQALVITVDSPQFGQRERDIKNQFHDLPAGLRCENLVIDGVIKSIEFNNHLNWNDIKRIQKMTKLPIILKGILHPADALMALEHGISGIIVSNHGGRQLDGTAATIDLVTDIASVVQKKIPIIVDGGIRRGSDIVKALALGADAVAIGRPILWGLAVEGEEGVRHIIRILKKELLHTLALCGCQSLQTLSPDYLYHNQRMDK